ncbi:MAG: DUF4434 domain-containing protein [Tannerella sp.]|jgi:hypothetical protein|nr:DUF4434 domain-containing protein [Tannerella sp.]
MENKRRDFIKQLSVAGAAMATGSLVSCTEKETAGNSKTANNDIESRLIVPKAQGLKLTGTFIDEISHDIPHQNWGEKEWDQDFRYMQAVGIDTVIMIRSGYKKFITYPSEYLMKEFGCYKPSVDLLDMFLRLADKYGMKFYFGLYDSGKYWATGDLTWEIESNKYVIEEVWKMYGHFKSFQGWYLSQEISRATKGAINAFSSLGKQCKDVSGGLPTLISPWIDGKKAVAAASSTISREDAVSVEQHEKEWSEIFDGIKGNVDACAFQDGHIDYDELDAFFSVNKKMADRYGIECWTNAETFDRDMPIKFLPIKFDKLRLKLEAAARVNYDKGITFEFSHFMSPQSAYLQAGHLYDRYKEYFNI